MSKRVGISLLLAFTMLASALFSGNGFKSATVYASPACLTISDCLGVASEARDNIAEIVNQEDELSQEIAELNGEITTIKSEIESLESSITATQTRISQLQGEISSNRALLEETEEEIEGLLDLVAERMTITQRMDNRNTVIALLTESADLNDFISQVRFFSKVANTDADLMDQLADVLDTYDGLLVELNGQVEEHEAIQENLQTEQASLTSTQETLASLEGDLRDQLYGLGLDRMSEEEALAVAEAARKVLESTPPPPIVTSSAALSDSSSSDNNSGNTDNSGESGESGSGVPASGVSASGVSALGVSSQNPGTNSGLSHPMPGASVSSEYGWRDLGSGSEFHWGIDVSMGGRPSILAAASGTVVTNEYHNSLGWWVVIAHQINGQRVDTLYAHMESQSPKSIGTVVSQGETIGTQGSTGFSTGPHLHFEVHEGGFTWNNGVNPRNWINF